MKTPRITGGIARSRTLASVPDEGVRPTSSRVREALFSVVGHDLTQRRVLDAFAGSGLLGLEAWSRGAEVVAVERAAKTFRQLRDNVAALGASIDCRRGDVLRLAPELGTFDIALLDPPYALDPTPLVTTLAPLTTEWLVLESDEGTTAPEVPEWGVDRRRTYGGTSLSFYRRRP